MDLKNLITNDKIIEVEHPMFDGLFVKLAYISREQFKKFIDKATVTAFDKKTKGMTETVDNDLLLNMYVPELIKGWRGFKIKYLADLAPVDLSAVDPEEELPFSEENAIELMKNSPAFDEWVSSIVQDVKNFNKSS